MNVGCKVVESIQDYHCRMEVTMSVPMLNKMHMNGYDVLSVNHGPWRAVSYTHLTLPTIYSV